MACVGSCGFIFIFFNFISTSLPLLIFYSLIVCGLVGLARVGHGWMVVVGGGTETRGGFGSLADWRDSIREFCDLSMPIIMFDKDSNFVVMKLEEVSLHFPCHYVKSLLSDTRSFFPCLSAPITWEPRTRQSRSRRHSQSQAGLRLF